MSYKFSIIGAGNGGQAMAAYFKMTGNEVRLYDAFEATVDNINKKGTITLEGAVETEQKIDLITTDLEKCVDGVDVIMVVNPAIYHRSIAEKLAPYLKEGQLIFLNPSAAFGAFAFKKALEDNGFTKNVTIAESNTLLFACRAIAPGTVHVGGKKDRLLVASFPASNINQVNKMISPTIKEIELCETVLETSFDSTNSMVHPIPTLMNASWSESGEKYKYYYDGIGPTIGNFIEHMDTERVEIGKALGLVPGKDLFDIYMEYDIEYNAHGDNVAEVVSNVEAYKDIYAGNSVRTRYIYEDVPMGLVPFSAIGELLGKPVTKMKLGIKMCEEILEENFSTCDNCRNLKNLGLESMNAEDIINYAKTGRKK